jgi:hydrogenase expression/formation protein HypE
LGKIDAETFAEVIYPELGPDRDDIQIGPQHGIDFGVLDIGGQAIVVATDPVSILPALGLERAGRVALDIVLADVAVSGIPPTHLTISLSLPSDFEKTDLERLWAGIAGRAATHGVSIIAGHTARYDGVSFPWIGAATAMGVGPQEDLVRPDGASPGDSIIVTTGPGTEVAALFSHLFPETLDLPVDTVSMAQNRVEDLSVVADAAIAAETGAVTAMHDATEGGLRGALTEMAHGAGVKFAVNSDQVPTKAGVDAVFSDLGIDPWKSTSAGTLIITADQDTAPAIVTELNRSGTAAAVVGTVSEGRGVVVDGDLREPPGRDPSWAAYTRLANARDSQQKEDRND